MPQTTPSQTTTTPRAKWPSASRTKPAIPWSARPPKRTKTLHKKTQQDNPLHIPQPVLKDRLRLLRVPEITTRATCFPIPSPRFLESLPMPSKTSTTEWSIWPLIPIATHPVTTPPNTAKMDTHLHINNLCEIAAYTDRKIRWNPKLTPKQHRR